MTLNLNDRSVIPEESALDNYVALYFIYTLYFSVNSPIRAKLFREDHLINELFGMHWNPFQCVEIQDIKVNRGYTGLS